MGIKYALERITLIHPSAFFFFFPLARTHDADSRANARRGAAMQLARAAGASRDRPPTLVGVDSRGRAAVRTWCVSRCFIHHSPAIRVYFTVKHIARIVRAN